MTPLTPEQVPRFDRDTMPTGGWVTYQQRGTVRAIHVTGPFEVVDADGKVTACTDGYVLPGADGWPLAVPAERFAASYEAMCTAPVGTVAEAGRWLAQMSGSPRYGPAGLGWQGLLTEGNVEHAAAAAKARGVSGGSVSAAVDRLLRWIREAR